MPGQDFLERAYALHDQPGAKALYDEWAGSYDEDLDSQGYESPQRVVEAILANLPRRHGNIAVLDAGCGTGLVAELLVKSAGEASFVIDGCDLSPGMLQAAVQKGIYRNLDTVDLSTPTSYADNAYDVVACCGTLTKGHVGPEALREFVRLVLPTGLIVATVHAEIWESEGYRAIVDTMKQEDLIDIVSIDGFGIVKGSTSGGIMVIVRKLAAT